MGISVFLGCWEWRAWSYSGFCSVCRKYKEAFQRMLHAFICLQSPLQCRNQKMISEDTQGWWFCYYHTCLGRVGGGDWDGWSEAFANSLGKTKQDLHLHLVDSLEAELSRESAHLHPLVKLWCAEDACLPTWLSPFPLKQLDLGVAREIAQLGKCLPFKQENCVPSPQSMFKKGGELERRCSIMSS